MTFLLYSGTSVITGRVKETYRTSLYLSRKLASIQEIFQIKYGILLTSNSLDNPSGFMQ